MSNKIFWKESFLDGKAEGGIFYRAAELNQFIKLVEEKEGEVVGIRFDENNIELIIEKKENESKTD